MASTTSVPSTGQRLARTAPGSPRRASEGAAVTTRDAERLTLPAATR